MAFHPGYAEGGFSDRKVGFERISEIFCLGAKLFLDNFLHFAVGFLVRRVAKQAGVALRDANLRRITKQ